MGLAGGDTRHNIEAIALFALLLSFSSFAFFDLTGRVLPPATPDCIKLGTCYAKPSFWAIAESSQASTGVCTTSGSYVDATNALYVTLTSPPSPPVNPQSVFFEYVMYDFDVHVTILGTSGQLSVYDNDLGLGIPLSREMSISGFGANVEESASLQISGGISVGPGQMDHYSLEILRTAGTGSVCLDDWEGSGFVLASGGTPS